MRAHKHKSLRLTTQTQTLHTIVHACAHCTLHTHTSTSMYLHKHIDSHPIHNNTYIHSYTHTATSMHAHYTLLGLHTHAQQTHTHPTQHTHVPSTNILLHRYTHYWQSSTNIKCAAHTLQSTQQFKFWYLWIVFSLCTYEIRIFFKHSMFSLICKFT